jgi:hypothetical protein
VLDLNFIFLINILNKTSDQFFFEKLNDVIYLWTEVVLKTTSSPYILNYKETSTENYTASLYDLNHKTLSS